MPTTSPKGKEQAQSWGKSMRISIETQVHPQARQPLALTTGMRASIQITGHNVTVSWAGGSPIFQLLFRELLTDSWVPASEPMMGRTVTIPMFNGPTGYFLVQEQVPLLTGQRVNGVTTLNWTVPVLE